MLRCQECVSPFEEEEEEEEEEEAKLQYVHQPRKIRI